jgi:uncharacterized damage-inducible protein DinB
MVLRDAVRKVLIRDLNGLDREIAAYPDDESLWLTPPGISNSAGNLVQHLTGNIRHFFGAVLAKNGYVRNRDAEFATKGRSRAELREDVRATIAELDSALDSITPDQLKSVYPIPLRDSKVRTADFVTHLAVHFAYHLGQIDYLRRLLTANPVAATTVDTMAMAPLFLTD